MATSTRVRGNVAQFFTLKTTAGTLTTLSDDLKKVSLTSDDKDAKDLTFAEIAAGVGKDYTLTLTGIVSFDTASLWSYLWANSGATATFDWAPRGNATATATSPHFKGTVTLVRPDIELEASTDLTGAEFEVELSLTTDVTLAVS